MSLIEILGACFGTSGGGGGDRQAPYLNIDEAAQMPLDMFIGRSLESAPSTMQQYNAFADIFMTHVQNGASPEAVAQMVQKHLLNLSTNDTNKATVQWATRLFTLSLNNNTGTHSGYAPPNNPNGTYAQAAGSNSGNWQVQQNNGNHNRHNTKHDGLDSGVYIRSFFFPSEESFQELINFLGSANSTLDICVFNITDNDIARAIIDAKRRGVQIRIITDDEQLNSKGNDVERLNEQHGIPFKTDNNPDAFMHSKFAVIDKRALWMGSYNWTVGARKSNIESVICTNDKHTVQAFSKEFERLWRKF